MDLYELDDFSVTMLLIIGGTAALLVLCTCIWCYLNSTKKEAQVYVNEPQQYEMVPQQAMMGGMGPIAIISSFTLLMHGYTHMKFAHSNTHVVRGTTTRHFSMTETKSKYNGRGCKTIRATTTYDLRVSAMAKFSPSTVDLRKQHGGAQPRKTSKTRSLVSEQKT